MDQEPGYGNDRSLSGAIRVCRRVWRSLPGVSKAGPLGGAGRGAGRGGSTTEEGVQRGAETMGEMGQWVFTGAMESFSRCLSAVCVRVCLSANGSLSRKTEMFFCEEGVGHMAKAIGKKK